MHVATMPARDGNLQKARSKVSPEPQDEDANNSLLNTEVKMPQKALFNKVRKSQGKSLAANRHGKVLKQKKGIAPCVDD